jgi:hypothetical protein
MQTISLIKLISACHASAHLLMNTLAIFPSEIPFFIAFLIAPADNLKNVKNKPGY